VVTAGNLEVTAAVRKKACFHVFDPGAIDAQGHFVFTFTGSRTGVAPNALAIVDDEAVIHKFLLPFRDNVISKGVQKTLFEEAHQPT
jgi:hypothetical protein